MPTNSLQQLSALGQSIWIDSIGRSLISGGGLRRLIDEDGLRGMTSNPAIFERAMTASREYDIDVRLLTNEGKNAEAIYETLSQRDVRSAADEFRALYDSSNGQDGYVSLEVNPHLAYDAHRTVEEARRLWAALNRPNVMIKVPATASGLVAIEQLISEGINVNVTLLFGLKRYRQVANAYLAGIEKRVSKNQPVARVASVASFFVSRIDSLVDPLLDKLAVSGSGPEQTCLAKAMRGRAAVASAKLAYRIHNEIFSGDRFTTLTTTGARRQRLLWASTESKDPKFSDTKYVDELVGLATVNTLPISTLRAYRDHGKPALRLESDIAAAELVLAALAELGIEIDQVAQQLEDEGITKFIQPFDRLLTFLARRFPLQFDAITEPTTSPPLIDAQLAAKL